MQKNAYISSFCQVLALLLVMLTGFNPASFYQEDGHSIYAVQHTVADQQNDQDEDSNSSEDYYEVVSVWQATPPGASLHVHTLPAAILPPLPSLNINIPMLLAPVAPATQVYFKTLFRRIISPNAP